MKIGDTFKMKSDDGFGNIYGVVIGEDKLAYVLTTSEGKIFQTGFNILPSTDCQKTEKFSLAEMPKDVRKTIDLVCKVANYLSPK